MKKWAVPAWKGGGDIHGRPGKGALRLGSGGGGRRCLTGVTYGGRGLVCSASALLKLARLANSQERKLSCQVGWREGGIGMGDGGSHFFGKFLILSPRRLEPASLLDFPVPARMGVFLARARV